jgi:PKD repeat protein
MADPIPIAELTSAPANPRVGQEIRLDGTASKTSGGADYQNNPANMTFVWNLNSPRGSRASLNSKTADKVSFTPDVKGEYTVSLVVTDTSNNTASEQKDKPIQVDPVLAPIAKIKPVSGVIAGEPVKLDGTGSKTQDGSDYQSSPANLSFKWELSAPSESTAALDDETDSTPSFTPDKPGNYTASLVVTDAATNKASTKVNMVVKTKKQWGKRVYRSVNEGLTKKPWLQKNPLGGMFIGGIIAIVLWVIFWAVAGWAYNWAFPPKEFPLLTSAEMKELDEATEREREILRATSAYKEVADVHIRWFRKRTAAGILLRNEVNANAPIPVVGYTPKQVLEKALDNVNVAKNGATPRSVPDEVDQAIASLQGAIGDVTAGDWTKTRRNRAVGFVKRAADLLKGWGPTKTIAAGLDAYASLLSSVTDPTKKH